jgi:hypothetical protein
VTRRAVSMNKITYTAWFSMRTCAPRVRAPSSGSTNQLFRRYLELFASGARAEAATARTRVVVARGPPRAWPWRSGLRGRRCGSTRNPRSRARALPRYTRTRMCWRAGRLIASLTESHRVRVLLPELYIAMVRRGHLRVRREIALLELPP